MYAYIDETGNTGKDIFSIEQPLFITAAILTKKNFDLLHKKDIKRIAEKIGANELHANDLGIERIEHIAEDLLTIFKKCDARFFISRIEKKYLAVTKLVDTLFDPSENKAVPPHVYYMRHSRLLLTYKIAISINEDVAKKFWSSLIENKKSKAHEIFLESLLELEQGVLKISDEGLKQRINDAIQWVKQHPESISIHSNKAINLGHLPNMVAFHNLLNGIEQRSKIWKIKVVEIVHDRQCQFEKTLKDGHDLHKNAPAGVIEWMGSDYTLRCVAGSIFRISNSADSAGIQAVDIVIWLYKRFLDGKPIGCNSAKLMNYVFNHARQSDFSFKSLEGELNEYFSTKRPPTNDDLERAKEFLTLEEKYRQNEMLEYGQEKFEKRNRD